MNDKETLKQQLMALHQSLQNSDGLDEQTETLLQTILEDIEGLERRSLNISNDHTDDWEATLLSIENQYPNFSHAVRAIIETLGRMGI